MRFPTPHVWKDKVIPEPTFFGFGRFQIAGVVFIGVLVFCTYMFSLYTFIKATYGYKPDGVHTIRWAGLVPELEPVILELQRCGAAVRQTFPDVTMQGLFACDEAGPFGDQCEKQRQFHLAAIVRPSEEALELYKARQKKRRAQKLPRCKSTNTMMMEGEVAAIVGSNASIRVVDATPCDGEDRYKVQLIATAAPESGSVARDVTGEAGTLFAAGGRVSGRFRLDHLEHTYAGWISGGPCAVRVQKAVEELNKNNPGFLSASASDAFRGLFWYPPGGFDSWHTDSNLLPGWRLYLVDVDQGSESFFAYQDGNKKWHKLSDSSQKLNMFKIDEDNEVWHSVATLSGHRLSLGLGVSEGTAKRILEHLSNGHT